MELTVKGKSTIYIDRGVFAAAGEQYVSHFKKSKKTVIVTDSNVAPLYAQRLQRNLADAGIESTLHVIPAGEEFKTLETVSHIYPVLSAAGLTRTDAIVALGGGVIGDMTGFAGATYLRGIPVMQIPTTLLAQVDSSVGGKCGVDLPEGKNLVGAFHQPEVVLIDPDLLATLPRQTYCDGMAEVIKYGLICDRDLFDVCGTRRYGDDMTDVIGRCIAHKRDVVVEDELDTGLRMCLNFGHTIGHAIEKCGGYETYTHGQGVAMGMVAAARLGEHMGITPSGTTEVILDCLTRWELPTALPYDVAQLLPYMTKDKKATGKAINVVLLQEIGQFALVPMDMGELSDVMQTVFGRKAVE